MTTQHAPHTIQTPPLWRRVISLPKTGYGWWAVGVAAPSWVLFVFLTISEHLGWPYLQQLPQAQAELVLAPFWLTAILFGLLGVVAGLMAVLGRGERSWLVWVALVPGLYFYSFLVWFLFPLSVVIVVATVFLIVSAYRQNIGRTQGKDNTRR